MNRSSPNTLESGIKSKAKRNILQASSLSLDSSSVISGESNKAGYETIAQASTSPPKASVAASSVYLKSSEENNGPHITVIPINSKERDSKSEESAKDEKGHYDAIFDFDGERRSAVKPSSGAIPKSPTKLSALSSNDRGRRRSPSQRQRAHNTTDTMEQPPVAISCDSVKRKPASSNIPKNGLFRRQSEKAHPVSSKISSDKSYNIQQRIRRKSQRSSSLGPLLDGQTFGGINRTNSLESIDSNPRQAVAKSDRAHGTLVPKRPLMPNQHHFVSPPPGMPPHIPLPGLMCQFTIPQALSSSADPISSPPPSSSSGQHQTQQQSPLREQQVLRLRQEIVHASGVRLLLRRRDCHNSIALVELFGRIWVAGWKQREFPILYNAFHIGDQVHTVISLRRDQIHDQMLQILSAGNVPIRTVSEFNRIIKAAKGTTEPHVEIIIRRLPFAQVRHMHRVNQLCYSYFMGCSFSPLPSNQHSCNISRYSI